MTEEQKPRIKQTLSPSPRRISKDIIPSYIGKNIVMELEDVGYNVSSGYLEKYDGRFLLLRDYKQHTTHLESATERITDIDHPSDDLISPESVRYSLPSRLINVNIIASITTLDDLLEARKR